MTGIERNETERKIADLQARMKRKNQEPGMVIGRGYGMMRLARELAYWMSKLESA